MGYRDEEHIGMYLIFSGAVISWYIYIAYDIHQFERKRKRNARKSSLLYPEAIEPSMIYMGGKILENENSLDLFEGAELKLHIQKKNGRIVFKRFGKTKTLATEDIAFLVFEYAYFWNATFHRRGANYWVIHILAKPIHSENLITLAELITKRNNGYAYTQDPSNDERRYFHKGLELTKVLSWTMNKPYKVHDPKGATSTPQ